MDLSDDYTGEIKKGKHVLEIIAAEHYQSDTGTEIFRFTLENKTGQTICQNFPDTKRGRQFLTGFAVACGFNPEDFKDFEVHHLIGMKVGGEVFMNDSGYWALKKWYPAPSED